MYNCLPKISKLIEIAQINSARTNQTIHPSQAVLHVCIYPGTWILYDQQNKKFLIEDCRKFHVKTDGQKQYFCFTPI